MAQWLIRRLRDHVNDYESAEEYAVSDATENNHRAIVEWLHSYRTDGENPTYDITLAAQGGRLQLVQWMALNAHASHDVFMTANVAANGHLEMLRWLHENVPYCVWHSGVMDAAAENNHLHVVKWLHANRTEGCTTKAMNTVESLEMVEWLHFNIPEAVCTIKVMDSVTTRSHFDTLLFLHAYRSKGCSVRAAANAFENGHFAISKWLMQEYTQADAAHFNGSKYQQL